jgi:hypothetical protein
MLFFILIVVGLIVSCTVFAMLGARVGARMEEKQFGAGTVEASMREGMSASVLGALLGIIPFLLFLVALVVTIITNPLHHDDGTGGSQAASSSH